MVQIQGLTAENSKSVAVCECWEGKCLLTHVVKLMIQACTMSYSHLEKRSVKLFCTHIFSPQKQFIIG